MPGILFPDARPEFWTSITSFLVDVVVVVGVVAVFEMVARMLWFCWMLFCVCCCCQVPSANRCSGEGWLLLPNLMSAFVFFSFRFSRLTIAGKATLIDHQLIVGMQWPTKRAERRPNRKAGDTKPDVCPLSWRPTALNGFSLSLGLYWGFRRVFSRPYCSLTAFGWLSAVL